MTVILVILHYVHLLASSTNTQTVAPLVTKIANTTRHFAPPSPADQDDQDYRNLCRLDVSTFQHTE